MLDSGLDKHGLCKQQGLSAGQGVPTMNPASLPTHHPTPTPQVPSSLSNWVGLAAWERAAWSLDERSPRTRARINISAGEGKVITTSLSRKKDPINMPGGQ